MARKFICCLGLLIFFVIANFGVASAKTAEFENITAFDVDNKIYRVEIAFDGNLYPENISTRIDGKVISLDIDNAIPGRISRLSGTNIGKRGIVKKISTNEVEVNHTRIRITLTGAIVDRACKIYIEPKNRAEKKSARIVVDIDKNYFNVDNEKYNFKDKIVVLDAGHGGSDKGAVGPSGITEKSVTLAVALKVEKLLKKEDIKVVMTRRTDVDVAAPGASDARELQARIDKCPPQTDIFISIHCNAFTNPKSHGMETYYSGGSDSHRLAELLNEELLKYGGRFNRGVKSANFYVLRRNNFPSSLIELAFITNPEEEKLLADDDYQNDLARAIVNAVNRYFSGK